MKQETFFVIILLIVVLGFASGIQNSSSGPIASPPNPNAEFGVVHETKPSEGSFFGIGSSGNTSSGSNTNTPPATSPKPITEDILKKAFSISSGNARSRDINNEYIDIRYNGDSDAPDSISISNWTISNARGESYKLGFTTNVPGIGDALSTQNQEQLVLKKGSTLHIITGRSPLGINFRTNKCMDYFNQFHSFVPGLPGGCPSPSREYDLTHVSDRCYQFVRGYGSCRTPLSFPDDLDNQCRDLVTKAASYGTCIQNHKNDQDFYQNQWWTYLNRPEQVWSDVRETITLTNERGTVIATASYD